MPYQTASLHALTAYSLALLRTYQLAMYAPKGLWQKLLLLYKELSEAIEEGEFSLSEVSFPPFGRRDLNVFYSTVLLATVNPYQLKASDQEMVFQFFLKIIKREHFSMKRQEGALFVLTLMDDAPPTPLTFNQVVEGEALYIDNQAIIQCMEKMDEVVDLSIKEQIKSIWQETCVRRDGRYQSEGRLGLIYGLPAVHHYFSGQGDIADTVSKVEKEAADVYDLSVKTYNDASDELVAYYQKKIFKKEPILTHVEAVSEWQVDNCSLSGACLTSESASEVDALEVGRFIAIKGIGNYGITTGLIRWVNYQYRGKIAIGVEYIARVNIDIQLQSDAEKRMGKKSMGFLAKQTYTHWPEKLIMTQQESYEVGEGLTLMHANELVRVKLKACIVETPHCKLFAFEPVDS